MKNYGCIVTINRAFSNLISRPKNQFFTHEVAVAPLVPHFVRSANTDLKENSSRYRSCFFEAPEFSQIAFGDFSKSYIRRNCSTTLKK